MIHYFERAEPKINVWYNTAAFLIIIATCESSDVTLQAFLNP